ncbi:MAG: chalcone isomerase family protein [Deltaproteobacteria bacterium]|nr:chalcone isomerase family protein [Deltaproteobacteria bacterium]
MFQIPLLLLLSSASAAQLAGVILSDTATVGGEELVLNGMGLREKYFIDVYVGGLYLPSLTTDSSSAITQDTPKRLLMTFTYKQVTQDQLCESYMEGLANNVSDPGPIQERFEQLCGMLTDVVKGDEMILDYVPGSGTAISLNGAPIGTLEGADFMQALWSVYLGPRPPTGKFKRGLLGR